MQAHSRQLVPPKTIIEKVWEDHVVVRREGVPDLVYIDLHLLHEVTSPQAFLNLVDRGLNVRHPNKTVAVTDHSIPTHDRSLPILDRQAALQIEQLEVDCYRSGIPLYGPSSVYQGIVHVIGPERGLVQPGMTVACGDSHTATHGALGALTFGVGTSQVGHILAAQSILQSPPRTFKVQMDGRLPPGVSAKDLILHLIATIGVNAGTGHILEYCGSTIRSLSIEERMTICNMSVECGARGGIIAPDDTTYSYLAGRSFAPSGGEWDKALTRWRRLPTDEDATFDREVSIDVSALEPMVTFGTTPAMAIPISAPVPDPSLFGDPLQRAAVAKALVYMNVVAGKPLLGHAVDVVFIGSCTNARIHDLRAAAQILKGRTIHPSVRLLVVPGSQQVKLQAQTEGLDLIFKQAGAEWREPGCSLCIAMNGDRVEPYQTCLSTSNRNFEGRQGKDVRTFLASPETAAASAIAGVITDARSFL